MMGYRSDVAIAIYGEEDQMVAFIAASRLKEDFTEVFKECEIYPYQGGTHLMLSAQFDGVKWYDGYEDVDRWNKFVRLAEEHYESINTEYVRVGEETDDNVHNYGGPDPEWHLGIRREVYTDLPEKQEEANEARA